MLHHNPHWHSVHLSFALLTLLCCHHCVQAQNSWELVSLNTPEGIYSNLTDVSFWSASGGVVVGSNQYAFYTLDSGKTWTQKATPAIFNTICHFDALHGIATRFVPSLSSGDVYASIWRTSDGGDSWKMTFKDSNWLTTFRGVGFWDSLQGCIIGDYYHALGTFGTVQYSSSDAGASWSSARNDSGILGAYPLLSSLSIVDAYTGYALLGYTESLTGNRYSLLLRTTDAGHSWNAQGSSKFSGTAVATFVNERTGTIIENGSRILRSEDGGVTWREQNNPVSIALTSVCFGTPAAGVAVGGGAIISTSDGGTHWQSEATPIWLPMSKVYVSSDGHVIAIGSSGTIIRGQIHSDPWLAPNGTLPLLAQNYPNPFNASTTIRYELPRASSASLKIFNVLGQLVATLVNEDMSMGTFRVQWSANVPSGIYFYRLRAGEYVETKKMILLR